MGNYWSGWYKQDHYILKGGAPEEWEPRFTYHGFRFVEVEGWPGKPDLSSLEGRVVHTDFKSAGSFSCSDPLVNAIQEATLWSYRANFHGFPTDCPTREKKGWTGDAHLACDQAMFNLDNKAGICRSGCETLRMRGWYQGRLKTVIPSPPDWGGEACDWTVAAVLIPWAVYVQTGDRKIVEESYPMMKKWVDYYAREFPSRIIDSGVSDWCPVETRAPKEITSTCYYYGAVKRLAKMAVLLDKKEDAASLQQLAETVRQAFCNRFVTPDGTVGEGSQSAQACALYFELIPTELRVSVAKKLSEAVTAANDHVDVGVLGAKALFRTLSDNGYHERALAPVLQQKNGPGYNQMVARGNKTLCEDWNGGGT